LQDWRRRKRRWGSDFGPGKNIPPARSASKGRPCWRCGLVEHSADRKAMDRPHELSVQEYHNLIQAGILTTNDRVELLERLLVERERRTPQHDYSLHCGMEEFQRILPVGWDLRVRCAITLSDSEPEPDLACVKGDDRAYVSRHPGPADIGQLTEVADSSLDFDRTTRGRIYARAGIVCYWIINLVDRQIEVYSSPSGPTANPSYAQRTDYRAGDQVPLILDGVEAVRIPVQELLP
jgi:Uma2 family endonuclease